MRNRTVIGLVIVVGFVLLGAAFASGQRGSYDPGACQNADVEKVKQFQKETLSLRDDLMTKRRELRTEYQQTTPDSDRISKLNQEIRELRASIKEIANKYGVDPRCINGRPRMEGRGVP